MYNKCELREDVGVRRRLEGEAGRGDRTQAGPSLAQGSCRCSNLKWRLGRPLAGQHPQNNNSRGSFGQ